MRAFPYLTLTSLLLQYNCNIHYSLLSFSFHCLLKKIFSPGPLIVLPKYLTRTFPVLLFHYECIFFFVKMVTSTWDRPMILFFCSSAYFLYIMRFSHPIALCLCAEVSYQARFPHSTACLIGYASLIFKGYLFSFSLCSWAVFCPFVFFVYPWVF